MYKLKNLVGMTLKRARSYLNEKIIEVDDYRIKIVRVVLEDGKHNIVTMDFRKDRVNVHIENGRITSLDGVF